MKKDIVLVISDQHNGLYTSFNSEMEDITPNLVEIAKSGFYYENAYCNSPLCVPSRMSFLTGKLPSETKIVDNDTTLNSDEVTIAHEISLEGYETVLVGRMHFKGLDQFHGFDKRYIGDITSQYWGMSRDEISEFHKSFGSNHCQDIIGEGESPVIDYDRAVFNKACELLSQEREKPIFMVVGFYSPHYPYISESVDLQVSSSINENELQLPHYKEYSSCFQQTTLERAKAINKSYKKMIYGLDKYIGNLYKTYRSKSDGLFVYTSDHGDQLGKRSIYGKRTLYEDSIRIPMVINGIDTLDTKKEISLLGLRNVLISYAKDSNTFNNEKPVIVQSILNYEGRMIWCEAVIKDGYKLVRTDQTINLYFLSDDINEQNDLYNQRPEIVKKLEIFLSSEEVINTSLHYANERKKIAKVLNKHGELKGINYYSKFDIIDNFEPKEKYVYRKEDI